MKQRSPKGKGAWTARVGEKGQIVIPKDARDMFSIRPGDTVLLLGDEKRGLAILSGDKMLALGYFLSAVFTTLIICGAALCAGLFYLWQAGWYLALSDVLLLLLDTVLLVLFGTALSSLVNGFLATQGQLSAVGTIVSSCYGFICGAYMPLSMFPKAVRFGALLLPGTYSAGAFRNLFMRGALEEISSLSVQAAEGLREGFSMNLDFFGRSIGMSSQLWLFVASTAVVAAIVFGLRLAFFKGTSFLTPAGRKKGK